MTAIWEYEQRWLTPGDVRDAVFPLTRLGRRGLDEEAVRAYLNQVADTMTYLLNAVTREKAEVKRLRERIIARGDIAGAALSGDQDARMFAVSVLSHAQKSADQAVADARAYSARLTRDARSRHEEILASAQRDAERMVDEARSAARDAAVAELGVPGEPLGEADQRALQAQLTYARTFSDVYRTYLRAALAGLLNSIDEWERREGPPTQTRGRE
jgi:DivIVA domain-containing protein